METMFKKTRCYFRVGDKKSASMAPTAIDRMRDVIDSFNCTAVTALLTI